MNVSCACSVVAILRCTVLSEQYSQPAVQCRSSTTLQHVLPRLLRCVFRGVAWLGSLS